MTVQGTAGMPVTVIGEFIAGGMLADADAVQLDITYGSAVGLVPDVAGPFTFQGASSSTPGQIWRVSTGEYACTWQVPAGTETGDYVANWSFTYQDAEYPAAENIWVSGANLVPLPGADLGFWTGAITNPNADASIAFGAVDANGTSWLWQSLTGWDSPPVQGAGVIPKSGAHGAWASPQYYAARTMTLTCNASAATQALRDVARAELQEAVPVGADDGLATLRYDEPIPKVTYVRRSGQVTEKCLNTCEVTFTIPLTAPDPRKYAATPKSVTITPMPTGGGGGMVVPFTVPFTLDASVPPGSGTVVNAGTFGSPPVALIYGPVTAPQLTNLTTGNTVSWSTLTLLQGDVFVVDFLNGQGYINPQTISTVPGMPGPGGTYWPADVGSAWWTLRKGTNSIQFGGQTGSGSKAVLNYADCWM
jgi:hypothetical protein